MILLDTHIWVWWINQSESLTAKQKFLIEKYQDSGLGISIISCWEIAKLVERGRLSLTIPVEEWLDKALAYPNVKLLELTTKIAVESTQLPRPFHRDPADQIIVATARVHNIALLTADGKIRAYPHVELAS